jgi:hypothetical protein
MICTGVVVCDLGGTGYKTYTPSHNHHMGKGVVVLTAWCLLWVVAALNKHGTGLTQSDSQYCPCCCCHAAFRAVSVTGGWVFPQPLCEIELL